MSQRRYKKNNISSTFHILPDTNDMYVVTIYNPALEGKPPSTGTVMPVTKLAASSFTSQFTQPISSLASPNGKWNGIRTANIWA